MRIKTFLFLTLLTNEAFAAGFLKSDSSSFTLIGKMIGRDTGRVILGYTDGNGEVQVDTAELKHGSFTFRGFITEPTPANLIGHTESGSVNDPNFTRIFLEPTEMTISIKEMQFKKARLTGSYSQMQFDTLNRKLAPIYEELESRNKEYRNVLWAAEENEDTSDVTQKKIKALREKVEQSLDKMHKALYAFAYSHPDSYVSAFILSGMVAIRKLPADSARQYYTRLSPHIRSSRMGQEIYKTLQAQQIFKANQSAIGKDAPHFTLKDIEGNTVSLSSFKGKKYVLLDFWASWCPPCMKGIPQVKQLYQQYRSRGLEVIGMSWDYQEKWWRRAVEEQGMDWRQIYLNIEEKNNFLSEQYGVSAIPAYILIDKEGKIIARSGSPELMEQKLKEIFDS